MAFFITTPRKPSLGEQLGAGLSTGLAKGSELALSSYLQGIKQQQKLADALTKQKQQAQSGFGKYAKDILGKDYWDLMSPEQKMEYQSLVGKMFDEYKDPVLAQRAAIDQLLQKDKYQGLGGPSLGKALTQTQKLSPVREGLKPSADLEKMPKSFWKGLNVSALGKISHLLTQPGMSPEALAEKMAVDPGLASQLAKGIGTTVGDLWLYITGARIGKGRGMLALPALAHSTIDEVSKHLSSKDKMTLAKGGESALKIADRTVKAYFAGGLLKKIPGAVNFLKQYPVAENILKNYTAEKLVEGATATAILGTVDPILEGRKPTAEDFSNALQGILAFELVNMPVGAKGYFTKKFNQLKDIVKNPRAWAEQVKERFQEQGGSEEALNAGDSRQFKILNKSLNDVQKRAESVKERVLKEKLPTYKEKKALEERVSEKKRVATVLKEKPIEEWMKQRELPKTEQKLVDKKNTLQSEVEKTQRQLDQVKETLAKPKDELKAQAKGRKNAELAEEHLTNQLENQKKQLEEVSAKVKEAREERMRKVEEKRKATEKQDLQKSINEHLKKLQESAKEPGSETDKQWKEMFDRDQKYIDEARKLAESGELPIKDVYNTGTKILEAYNKAYKELLNEANRILEIEKGTPRAKLAKEIKKRLERNLAINEAKLYGRKQKQFAKQALKGPGKAFMKQYLKDIGAQAKMLEKDIFEVRKQLGTTETKTQEAFNKVTDKNFETLKDNLSDTIKGKESPKSEKAANESAKKSDFQEQWKKIKDAFKTNKGKPDKIIKEVRALYKHIPFVPRLIMAAVINEALRGMGIPYWMRLAFVPAGIVERGAAVGLGGYLRKSFADLQMSSMAKKIKEAKSTREKTRLLREYREKHGTTKANQLKKRVTGMPSYDDETIIEKMSRYL